MKQENGLPKLSIESLREAGYELDFTNSDVAFIENIGDIPEAMGVRLDMNAFVLCLEGKFSFLHNGKPITIHKNNLFVCPPQSTIEDCMVSTDFKCAAMLLSQNLLQGLLHNYIEIWDKAIYVDKRTSFEIEEALLQHMATFDKLIKDILKTPVLPMREVILASVLRTTLLEFCSFLMTLDKDNAENGGSAKFQPTAQPDLIFRRFIDMLAKQEVKKRPVSFYSSQLCISPKYLSTIVKEKSGKTVLEWIHEYVDNDIRYYLLDTALSIKEISSMLNFPNISFFGKYVKDHFGCSPRQLRNAHSLQ